MLTRRGWGLTGTSLGMWLASRALGIPELSMLALASAALVLLAIAFTAAGSASLTAQRIVATPRLHHGETGEVEIRLHNAGRLPTALLQVRDILPATLSDATMIVLRPLAAGDNAVVRYPVHGRLRGRWEFGPVQLWLRDPFGLVARPRPLAAGGHLTVYPPVVALPSRLPLSGNIGSGATGRPRPLAHGDELAMVREYVRGDDLRKVHWRSTAHRGALMVRQDEAPQQAGATLVLDVRSARHQGLGAASSLEYAVTAAASVTIHLAARAHAVLLLTGPVATAPVAHHHELALEQLAVVQASAGDMLAPVWQQLATGIAATGSLITITTVPDAGELRAMVRGGRGFPSRTALLIDSGSFHRRGRPRDEVDPEAAATALRQAGWRAGIQRAGEPLDEVWEQLVRQRMGVRR